MVVSRGIARFALVVCACGAVLSAPVLAQPLVTGDLTIYYDFDDFTNTVMDKSGNNFHGKVQDGTRKMLDGATPRTEITTTGVITNDKSNPKRGAGAIRFAQTADMMPNPANPDVMILQDPVFLDMDGGVIKANQPAKLPSSAVTYAAWLNLEPVNGTNGWNSPASIFQGSTAGPGHGNPHIHAEGGGSIRVALRDEFGTAIVNSSGAPWSAHPFPNQPDIDATGAAPELWPTNEWFHVAVTYDKNADGGNGFYALYYNGEIIQSGPPNGAAGPSDLGQWDQRAFDAGGNFFDGLGLGAVYDSGGRRTHGMMDEVYIFTRALSEAEIGTLVNILPAAGLTGDYNNNGTVDAADYVLWRDGGPLQNEGDMPGTVNQADYAVWRANFGGVAAGIGAAAAVPEPATIAMLLACLSVAAARRRR